MSAAGCKGLPDVCDSYSGKTCIALEIEISSIDGPASTDAVKIVPRSGLTLTQGSPQVSLPKGTTTPFPVLVPILPATLQPGIVILEVQGLLQDQQVGGASATVQLGIGDHVNATAILDRTFVSGDMGAGGSGGAGGGGGIPPDMGNCDPVNAAACGSGEKCEMTSPLATTTTCEANGTVTLGHSCTTTPDDCQAGDECEANFKYCARLCHTDSDCPTTAGPLSASNVARCGSFDSGAYAAGPANTFRCTLPCNPVPAAGASGCVSGTKCDQYGAGGGGGGGGGGSGGSFNYTDCYYAGTGTDGANCTYSSDCAVGYVCVGGSTTPHCRMYCRAGNDADCTISGQTCLSSSGNFLGACCPSAGC